MTQTLEAFMLKTTLAALFMTAATLVYAPVPAMAGSTEERLSAAELKDMTDRKIDVIKAALQLKPDQEKYWPAVEEAIRAKAAARHAFLEKLVSLSEQTSRREFNATALLRGRADALAQRSARLKALADAWDPLYQTLDAKQKQRLRVLSVYVLHEMRDAVESRRMQDEDEDYDD
jgi:zinc resistance-associated protein